MAESAELDLKDGGRISVSDLGGVVVNVLREVGRYAAIVPRALAGMWLSYHAINPPTREELWHLYEQLRRMETYTGLPSRVLSASRKSGTGLVDCFENLALAGFRKAGIRYDDDRVIQERYKPEPPVETVQALNIEELTSTNPILKGIVENPRWSQELKLWDMETLVREATSSLKYVWLGSIASRNGKPDARVNFRSGTYVSLNGPVPDDLRAVMYIAKIKDASILHS